MPVISAANVPPPATRPPLESTVKEPSALLIRPLSLTFNAPSIVVVLTSLPNSSVTVSRSMPAIVLPTFLPSSTKLSAVIAPPSIVV